MPKLTSKIIKGIRLVCASALIIFDRLRGRKVVMVHLAIAGQRHYFIPILKALRRSQSRIAYYIAKEGNWPTEQVADLGIPAYRVIAGPVYSHLRGIDLFISATQWADRPPKTTRICIFHGIPSKGVTFLPENMKLFDVLFMIGPLQRTLFEEFAADYPEIAKRIRTINVGYPKSDALLTGHYQRDRTLQELGLDPRKPTVIFAPVYEKGSALDYYGEKIIESLLPIDANILIKLHPMQCDPEAIQKFSSGINWQEKLKVYERHPHFRLFGTQAIEPLLAASDVMVTDISSVALEFMLLDRPVVYIDCPCFIFSSQQFRNSADRMKSDIRYNAGRSAGIAVESLDGLLQAVRRSIAQPNEFAKQRETIRTQSLYNPGRAANAAANAILELLELPQRLPTD